MAPARRWSSSRMPICVIAVGASLNSYTTEHGYLYPECPLHSPRQQAPTCSWAMARPPTATFIPTCDSVWKRWTALLAALRVLRHRLPRRQKSSNGWSTTSPIPPSFQSSRPRRSARSLSGARSGATCRRAAGDGQRGEHRLHDDALQRARLTAAGGPLLRLHRPDAARGDGAISWPDRAISRQSCWSTATRAR